jgi:diguanylate cyclase (GGDEF)-like protein
VDEAAAEPRPFLLTLFRQLTKPIQLAVPPAIALLIVAERNGFVAHRPGWYYAVLLIAITCTTSVVDSLWPDKTCTERQMVYRTSTMLAAITVAIYATGWGPTLAVAYGYAVAYAIRYAGSRATLPMMFTSLGCIALGQGAIVIGLAPTLIPQPLVHGLAILIAAATAMTTYFQGLVMKEREALERMVHDQKEELAYRAYHDSLTRLPNRTAFLEHLEAALETSRTRGHCVAVLFIDVDSFKAVNDSFGHAIGDRLLDEVAERLRGVKRPEDVVARFGGHEFTVLLQGLGGPADARTIAARISSAIQGQVQVGSTTLSVSASIGMAVSTSESCADDLLREADLSMYVQKQERRSRSIDERAERA